MCYREKLILGPYLMPRSLPLLPTQGTPAQASPSPPSFHHIQGLIYSGLFLSLLNRESGAICIQRC